MKNLMKKIRNFYGKETIIYHRNVVFKETQNKVGVSD